MRNITGTKFYPPPSPYTGATRNKNNPRPSTRAYQCDRSSAQVRKEPSKTGGAEGVQKTPRNTNSSKSFNLLLRKNSIFSSSRFGDMGYENECRCTWQWWWLREEKKSKTSITTFGRLDVSLVPILPTIQTNLLLHSHSFNISMS